MFSFIKILPGYAGEPVCRSPHASILEVALTAYLLTLFTHSYKTYISLKKILQETNLSLMSENIGL